MKQTLLLLSLLFSLTLQAQVNVPILQYDTTNHWNYTKITFPNDSNSLVVFGISAIDTYYSFNWYLVNTQMTGSIPIHSKHSLPNDSDYIPPLMATMDSLYYNYGINFDTTK